MVYLSVNKIGAHLTACYLIVMNRIVLLYKKSQAYYMSPIYGTVIHVEYNLLTQYLLTGVPQYGVIEQRQTGIGRSENHRVSDHLHIRAVCTHLVESAHLTFCHTVTGIIVICHYTERISVYEQAVTGRVFYQQGSVSHHCRVILLIVIDIIAMGVNLVLIVIDYYITEPLHASGRLVIDDAVTGHAVLTMVLLNH